MTDVPAPKVVDLAGKPVEVTADTDSAVFEVLEWAEKQLRGEKHVAAAVIVVDHMGRVGTHHCWTVGFAHPSISAATILQARMVADYERAFKEE